MSYREQCISILDTFDEAQLINVAAMLTAMRKTIDELEEKEKRNAEYLAKLARSDEQIRSGRVVVKTMEELEAMAQ